LYSSVYRLLLIDASSVAINYGLEVSTKSWSIHFSYWLAALLVQFRHSPS
jgi:hypothetical protein